MTNVIRKCVDTNARKRVGEDFASEPKMGRTGISLLEVIIATAILAGSAVMLTSMFSTGDRHTTRAEERTFAQMLCQSKLDELLCNSAQLLPMQAEVSRQFPGWVWSVDAQPTTLAGFIRVTVAVTRVPGMPTGADLSLSAAVADETAEDFTRIPDQPTFQLTRWMPYEGEIDAPAARDEFDSLQERLEARPR